MIRLMENITSEQIQDHIVAFNDVTANVRLRYNPQVQCWTIDCQVNNKAAYGIKLSVGTLHMESRNMPIDFIVIDNSGQGIDPVFIDDFSNERCSISIVDDETMADIRGLEVQ